MDEEVEYKACDGSLESNDGTEAFETKEQLYKFFKTQGIDFDDIDEESRLPKFLNKVLKNESAESNKFNNTFPFCPGNTSARFRHWSVRGRFSRIRPPQNGSEFCFLPG